jgi:HEAT repeat protein
MNKSGKNMKNQHQQVEALIQQSDPKLRPWAITEAAKFFAKIQNDPQIIPELLQALNDTYTKLCNQSNEPAKPRNQHQQHLEDLIQQSGPTLPSSAVTEAAKFFANFQNDLQSIPELLKTMNYTYTKLYPPINLTTTEPLKLDDLSLSERLEILKNKDKEIWIRLEVARSLENLRNYPEVTPALLEILKYEREETLLVDAVIDALAPYPPQDQLVAQELLKILGNREEKTWIREKVAESLRRFEDYTDQAIKKLTNIVNGSYYAPWIGAEEYHTWERKEAVEFLAYYGDKDDQAIDQLLHTAQKDRDWSVREAAIKALTRYNTYPGVECVLVDIMQNSKNLWLRTQAAEAFARPKTPSRWAARALIETLQTDPDFCVRHAAAESLKFYGEYPEARSALIEALKTDDDLWVREAAAKSLIPYGEHPEVRSAMIEVIQNDDPNDKPECFIIRCTALETLIPWVKEPEVFTALRELLAQAYEELRDDAFVPPVGCNFADAWPVNATSSQINYKNLWEIVVSQDRDTNEHMKANPAMVCLGLLTKVLDDSDNDAPYGRNLPSSSAISQIHKAFYVYPCSTLEKLWEKASVQLASRNL